MNEHVWLSIEGDPIPKGRPRHGKGRTFTPKRTLEAERVIRDHALDKGVEPFDVPVRVAMTFYCRTARRTDIDNLMKLVCDALIGVAYTDDHLIHSLRGRLHRKAIGETPRTIVCISSL